MASTSHFSSSTFTFLRDLAANNDREWFAANKSRYERHVKEPALHFIVDFASHLARISPHFRADPRGNGGSFFRIYRDTRFSKDKSPYKTHAGIQFRHEARGDVHAPGFYLHLEPRGNFVGVGIWHPDSATLGAIRDAIVDDPAGWKRTVGAKPFRESFELGGDSLVRPPRGYDRDHPLIDDLKRKDFIASTSLTQKEVTSPGFIDRFAALCEASSPFQRWLCKAVGAAY